MSDATLPQSQMMTEAREAPARCAAQLVRNAAPMRALGQRLRQLAPPFAATLARGSSDQAASFGKHLLELVAGVPTLSHAPSVGSIYRATSERFRGVPLFCISQSGRSPDLIAAAEDARRRGAFVVAITNVPGSPLADVAEVTVAVDAGPETSVAATKSFIATLVALTHLAAEWAEDAALLAQLPEIGARLEAAAALDWSAAAPALAAASDLLVLGRGPTLAIAGEAALKLKETAGLHAEAFSIAEVAHGPMTLVRRDAPVLALAPTDAAAAGLRERLAEFAARGAHVIAAGREEDVAPAACILPTLPPVHPAIDAIATIQSFYGLADAVARLRGRDPDRPPHLAKVTETL